MSSMKPVWSRTSDQIKNLIWKKAQAKKKRGKDPRPADFRRSEKGFREEADLTNPGSGTRASASGDPTPKEPIMTKATVKPRKNTKWVARTFREHIGEAKDLIGKKTASVEDIAKKHNITVDQVNAQIEKGVGVEREHTNSDAEAREIARDHLDEFPDYYDRLNKMEKKAKKDMNESKIADQIRSHPAVEYYGGAEDDHFVNLKKGWHMGDGQRSFGNNNAKEALKILKKQVVKFKPGEAKEYGLEEDAAAMSVGAGVIAGMPTADTADTSIPRPIGNPKRKTWDPMRRKKFAGKQVFVVDPTTFHKAYLGKRKYEHYEKYLEGCDIAEEIREFGRKYWDEPIIIQNEQTGAMVYLKYGRK